MSNNEFLPGELAPQTNVYEELNVFGSRTGKIALLEKGVALPSAPRGFRWRPLAELSVAELRARAAECRRMAATATTVEARDSLLRLADRYDALADKREREGP
jgi:hypothetical protein